MRISFFAQVRFSRRRPLGGPPGRCNAAVLGGEFQPRTLSGRPSSNRRRDAATGPYTISRANSHQFYSLQSN